MVVVFPLPQGHGALRSVPLNQSVGFFVSADSVYMFVLSISGLRGELSSTFTCSFDNTSFSVIHVFV
jgi:hypothetical protein